MLNFYKIADKKFLKYTDPNCHFSYYINMDDISRFCEYYDYDENNNLKEIYLCFFTKNNNYIQTSYKFSDLEDSL